MLKNEASQGDAGATYLGMNLHQFGIMMSITSLSRQMEEMVEGQEMKGLMAKVIEEHTSKSQEENLAWVRMQRNHLLNILHGVMVSQGMLAQIDDAIVNDMLYSKDATDALEQVELK